MKLAEWLNIPNLDGSRKRRDAFATSIGVTPQMISAYCAENATIWPSKETQIAIFKETGGSVTPNDWAGIEISDLALSENGVAAA